MKRNLSMLVLLCVYLFVPSSVLAQAAGDTATGAATGTLVAAAMESVGYHAQSLILTQLGQNLEQLSALVYLCVLISAILTAALMGQYRMALWILVGPPLFVYASGLEIGGQSNRINANGAEWQFGAFEDTANFRQKAMNGRPTQAEVSFFFHKYNELISEAYQELIRIVTDRDISRQMLFMARQRTMEDLFAGEIEDGKLHSLVAYFLTHCSTEMAAARMVAQGGRDAEFRKQSEYASAREQYCKRFPKKDKEFPPGPWQDLVFKMGFVPGPDVTAEQHKNDHLQTYGVVSCQQMWCWVQHAAKNETFALGEKAATLNLGGEVYQATGTQTWEKVVQDIQAKLTSTKNIPEDEQNGQDPCPMTCAGITPGGGAGGIQAGQSFDALAHIFSALLTKKAMKEYPNQEIVQRAATSYSGFTPYEDGVNVIKTSPTNKERMLRRQKAHELSTARRFEAFTLLMLLPYLQGALLYALAVAFPFFAMLILVPGQAGNFFTWLALWAWVKSWDVGWALVMVADELLWELLPKSTFYNVNNAQGYTPISLMEMHYHGDYSYSLSMYWLLLSAMMTAVPIVSAEAIMGTKRAIANVMLSGISDIATRLSGSAENWMANENVGMVSNYREQNQGLSMMHGSVASFGASSAKLAALDSALGPSTLEHGAQAQADTASALGGFAGMAKADAQTSAGQALEGIGKALPEGLGGKSLQETGQKMKQAGQAESVKAKEGMDRTMQSLRQNAGQRVTDGNITMPQLGLESMKRALSFIGDEAGAQRVAEKADNLIVEDLKKMGFGSGPIDGIVDPKQLQELNQSRLQLAKTQVLAAQMKEARDAKLMAGAAGAFVMGPAFYYPAGSRTLDAASDSQRGYIELQRLASSKHAELVNVENSLRSFARADEGIYLEGEMLRAYMAQNRNEWFFMPKSLTGVDATFSQWNAELDIERQRILEKQYGANWRWAFDMSVLPATPQVRGNSGE